MLYPIELTFENAREFKKQSVYFADPQGFENIEGIANHYKDNVLIGGLNGTGKSTIAAVFVCILNADVNEADPVDLISSSQAYSDENPWLFKGRLIFYNDGSLEDNKMFVEINARFEGITEHEKPRIRSKYFTIKEADSIEGLKTAREYVYSNKNDKYGKLEEYRKQIEALGISPDKYLLYWKQGETSKFTQIKDVERFSQFARMMGIEESITNLDRMIEQQTEKEKDVETVSNNCLQLEIELKKKEIDKNEKERRDEELMANSADFISALNALIDYNTKTTEDLKGKVSVNQQALNEQQVRKTQAEEERIAILKQQAAIQTEFDQCMSQIQKVNEQMVSVSQSVSNLEHKTDEGKSKYQQIKEFLDILKQKELGVEELQKLIEKLQSDLITIQLTIEQNESESTNREKAKQEFEEKIAVLESERQELEGKIIIAQSILKENPDTATLQEWIEGIVLDIEDKREALSNRENDRLRLEKELTSIAQALNFHEKDLTKDTERLQKEITQEEAQIKQCHDDLQKLDRDKVILENELSKESAEQLCTAISSLTNENENLNVKEKGYTEIIEQNGLTVVGLYHSIQKTGEELAKQIREIEAGLQEAKTQIDMSKQSMDELYSEQEKTQIKLKEYPLSPEEYAQKIKESRQIENELNLETDRVNQQIGELKDELEKVDQGIFDSSQRESMDKQGVATYAFQDVFEFKDTELNQEKEKNLSLLKYTILVEADEKDLFPYSGHYHVPLNEFVPDHSLEPLPFGLSLKSNISPIYAKQAVSWLRQINNYLSDSGIIKDNIGIRGYDPDKVSYFLSTAAREYTRTILQSRISTAETKVLELSARSSEQQEITSTLEVQKNELDNLLSKLSELTGKAEQLRKNLEEYRKTEEILQTEERKCRGFQEIINSVKDVFKETYDQHTSTLSFGLNEILAKATELIEQIELLESSKKLQIETKSKIEANTAQIAKLESGLTEYKLNQAKLEKINSEIQEWLELLVQEEERLASLKQNYNQKDKLLRIIKQWISEFDKYFSRQPFYLNIENSLENDGVLSQEETQAKAENLYLYEKQLNAILTDSGNLTKEIENLKLEKSRREEQCAKVVDAQKVIDRMPEKKQLADSIAELRNQTNDCSVDIKFLEKKINELKQNQEKTQESLNQYQGYFAKHQEIDFEFLNQYELAFEKLKIEREQHRKLLKEYHELAISQEEYRQQLEQIQNKIVPVDAELREIDGVIQELNEDNDRLTKRLEELQKDVTPTLDEEYDYRRLSEDSFAQITLGDCLPIFHLMYNGKFSEAVQQEYMPGFDELMKSLHLENQEITEEQKYTEGRLVINHSLKQLRTLTMKPIKESAVKDYGILKLEFEKNMRDKQRLEEELASFRSIVESDYRTVEGIITSSIRAISERMNEVFVPMNYTVQLEYRNKEEGNGHRRLVMWFKKTHEQQMRMVTERGGLSGGEHAIVSLMMMYSILSVKEEKKMEGKSGGYLLLDEWDANLDPLKAQTVFQILKKLRKKIISITPRSSSRNYLSEFGLLLRVINTPSRHGIVVLKERNKEALDEFFAELEAQEKKTDKVLV
jgi:chromosome segregation ATPase